MFLKDIKSGYLSTLKVKSMYLGNSIIYQDTPPIDGFITFSSPNPFTLAWYASSNKTWDGTIQILSSNGVDWLTWPNGSTASGKIGPDNKYYLKVRGVGNTKISGNTSSTKTQSFKCNSGSNISVSGNIMTLLDYQTVLNGEIPTIANGAFNSLFRDFTTLTSINIKIPGYIKDYECYSMFRGCTGLTTIGEDMFITPTNNGGDIYPCNGSGCAQMFRDCSALQNICKIPFLTYNTTNCLQNMFISTPARFSGTSSGEYSYIFRLPPSGTATGLTQTVTGTTSPVTSISLNTTYFCNMPAV